MNERKLHEEFMRLGRERHKITYKLLAMLSRIYEQEIYKKHGYATIYEYAGKLTGLPHSVVEKTLRTAKYLENKPSLQSMVEQEGIHKVALIARLATPETDDVWADKVKHMSKSSLQHLSKDMRHQQEREAKKNEEILMNNQQKSLFDHCGRNLVEEGNIQDHDFENLQNFPRGKFLPSQKTLKIELDEETEFLFLKLKKQLGGNLSNKEAFRRMLEMIETLGAKKLLVEASKKERQKEKREGKHAMNEQKEKIAGEDNLVTEKQIKGEISVGQCESKSRYIPAERRLEALQKTNGRCGFPGCNKPYDVFHHPERFSVVKNHDNIIPLCHAHHEFAHNGLIENETEEAMKWKISLTTHINSADQLRRKYIEKLSMLT